MKKLISFVTIIFLAGATLSGCGNTSDKPSLDQKQLNNQTSVINNSDESNINNVNTEISNDIDTDNTTKTVIVEKNTNIKESIQNNSNSNINNTISNIETRESISNISTKININNIENINANSEKINNNITTNEDFVSADSEEADSTETTTIIDKENQEKKEIIDSLVVAKYGVIESDIQKHKDVMYKLSLNLLHSLKEYNVVIILLPANDDLSSYLNNHYNTEYEIDKYSGMIYYNERIIYVQSKFSGKTTLHEIGHFFDYIDCYQNGQSHEEIERKSETNDFRDLVVSENYSYGRLEKYCKEDVLNYYKEGAYALSNLHEFFAESFARYFYYDTEYNSYEYDMPEIYNYYNNYHTQGII